MPFEFTSTVNAVARQQQLWGLLVGGLGGLVIAYAMLKGKGPALLLISLVLIGSGGYFFYRAWQLNQGNGEWVIVVDRNAIDWQSPNQRVDPSFTVALEEIDFVDRGTRSAASDERVRYHLVLKDQSVRPLNDVSGIDMDQFARYLEKQGVTVKETGRFYPPAELRNK